MLFLFVIRQTRAECACDKTENKCDLFCTCDSSCNSSLFSRYPFFLDSTTYPTEIVSCDLKHRIKRINHFSSYEIEVDSDYVRCFSTNLTEYRKNRKHKQLSFNDLGIENYGNLETSENLPKDYSTSIDQGDEGDTYEIGQPLLFNTNISNSSLSATYPLPIGINSRYCNAFYYVSYNITIPTTSCIFPHTDPSLARLFIPQDYLGIFTSPSEIGYELSSPARITLNYTSSTAIDLENPSITFQFPSSSVSSGKLTVVDGMQRASDGLVVTTSVLWTSSTFLTTGYIEDNPLLDENLNPVYLGNTEIKFGTSFSKYFTLGAQNLSDLFPDIDILRTPAGIHYTSNDDNAVKYIKLQFNNVSANTVNDISVTFYWRETGYKSMPMKILLGAEVSTELSSSFSNVTHFSVNFVELNQNGDIITPPENPKPSASLSKIFDLFFISQDYTIRTSGIFCVFVILVSIWVFEDFGFSKENF